MARTASPECGTKYDVPESAVGTTLTCRERDQRFEVKPIRVATAKPVPGPQKTILFAPDAPPPIADLDRLAIKTHTRLPGPNGVPLWKWVTGLAAAAAVVFVILPSMFLALTRNHASSDQSRVGPASSITPERASSRPPEGPVTQAGTWPPGTILRAVENADRVFYSPVDPTAYKEFVRRLEAADAVGAAVLITQKKVLAIDSGTKAVVIYATAN